VEPGASLARNTNKGREISETLHVQDKGFFYKKPLSILPEIETALPDG
jgi:hypothetical protein